MEGASDTLVSFSVIFGSICNGVGGSVFWCSQGKYLSNLVMICQEKSGLYTSIYWTITLGSQIFAYLFNSIILGSFDASVLFLLCTGMSLLSIVVYGILPEPQMPGNYVESKVNASETFRIMIRLFSDLRVKSMYGLFAISACAAATAQSLLVTFFCLILKDYPI